MTKEKPPLKNVYKKQLAIDLIKLGNNLSHTMRNRDKPQYQVFVFHHDEKLIRDLLYITERDRMNKRYNNKEK